MKLQFVLTSSKYMLLPISRFTLLMMIRITNVVYLKQKDDLKHKYGNLYSENQPIE
jgi:hypothetical protein